MPKDVGAIGDTSDAAWDGSAANPSVVALLKKTATAGSGGGGAATIADGADVAQGAVGDAAVAAGATGTVSAKLRRITQGLEDLKTLIVLGAGTSVIGHVINDAGEAHIGAVGGNTVVVQGSFARTNDANIYAAGDAVANATSSPAALVFLGCARVNAGTGLITGAKLVISLNAAASPKFGGELWLFAGTAAPTLSNDNALFTPLTADLNGGAGGPLVAKLPFTVPYVATAASGATGAVVYDADVVNQAFKCGAGVTSLWGLVVTRVAYQPVASEVFTFTLQIAQD